MKDTVYNQVLCTTDYDKFSFLTGNRAIKQGNLIKLRKSMEVKQLQTPIIVNEKFQIIDGQHRFSVIKDLGLPLFYMIVIGYSLEECQTLNANTINWSTLDFIKGYAELGAVHYIRFLEFIDRFPYIKNIRTYMYILQGTFTSRSSTRGEEDKLKTGKFEIKNWESSVDVATKLMDFKHCTNVFGTSTFFETMMKIFKCEKYDHARMLSKLSYQQSKLIKCVCQGDYLDLISDIYNFKTKDNEKVYFKYELSKK